MLFHNGSEVVARVWGPDDVNLYSKRKQGEAVSYTSKTAMAVLECFVQSLIFKVLSQLDISEYSTTISMIASSLAMPTCQTCQTCHAGNAPKPGYSPRRIRRIV